jgi:PAS domain S-box-containing protein
MSAGQANPRDLDGGAGIQPTPIVDAIEVLVSAKTEFEIGIAAGTAAVNVANADGYCFVTRRHGDCLFLAADGTTPAKTGDLLPADECIFARCMEQQKAVIVADVQATTEPLYAAERKAGIASMAIVPGGHEHLGSAIGVFWRTRHALEPLAMRRLEALARSAATSLAALQHRAELVERISTISNFYQLTDRLYRAKSSAEVYDASLDAIIDTLKCRRASILLFDQDGVMRFVAWRGLSEAYRKAVDGHTPWTPETRDAQPIFVPDIRKTDEPDWLKERIRSEDIVGLAFIPLTARGKVIGKFMAYYREAHVFDDHEVGLAVTIARQLGFALERLRAENEREAVQETLRRNEERLRLATQTGKVGLWEWDIRRNLVSWTDSLYPIHGVDRDTFDPTVEGFSALIHPDDKAKVAEALRHTLEEGAPYELEFRIVRPDGRVVWLFADATVLHENGVPVQLVGATVDISERKHAEDALRESEERFRLMSEQAPVMIWMSTPEGHCLHLNRMLRDFWGVEEEDIPRFDWRSSMHPDDAPEIGRQMTEALRARKSAVIEGRYRNAENEYRLLRTDARPRFSPDGEFLGMIGVNTDITERSRAEAQRNLLIAELNHRVKNTLAVVQGIAQQTFKGAESAAHARQAFEGRLFALANAHSRLTQTSWESARLEDLIADAIRANTPEAQRIRVTGPSLLLPPRYALAIAMALHELHTNAVKYGALSNDAGTIDIDWQVAPAEKPRIRLVWREAGGPAVEQPRHRGFGSRLIEAALVHDLDAEVSMEFLPQGLVCRIEAPHPEHGSPRP